MTPLTINQTTDQDAEYRAQMVAAIRALADFVETRTDLPVPNSVHAQHSLTRDGAINADRVRTAAEALGLDPRIGDHTAYVTFPVSQFPVSVDYVVHGHLAKQDAEGGA